MLKLMHNLSSQSDLQETVALHRVMKEVYWALRQLCSRWQLIELS